MRALVTGVTRGIGRALVGHLVAGGWDVVAVGRRSAELHELADGWGPQVTPHVADVTDVEALGYVVAASGPLDLAVANAGGKTTKPLARRAARAAAPFRWATWAGIHGTRRGAASCTR